MQKRYAIIDSQTVNKTTNCTIHFAYLCQQLQFIISCNTLTSSACYVMTISSIYLSIYLVIITIVVQKNRLQLNVPSHPNIKFISRIQIKFVYNRHAQYTTIIYLFLFFFLHRVLSPLLSTIAEYEFDIYIPSYF